MLIDLNSDGVDRQKQYDVCIVGAGPAGIVLATRLADKDKQVLVLEAGGLGHSEQSQNIYRCTSTARDAWPASNRLRFLGGTSNHWAGRCRPFEAFDFDRESVGSIPGWPIAYSEISPYLEEAMEILDLPQSGFSSRNSALPGGDFAADTYAHSPPTRFRKKYLDSLKESARIDLYINANAYALHESESRISEVSAKSYTGYVHQFEAELFILAMGAIENARFLLNQTETNPYGIGNSSGYVGKCFMEHLNVDLGEWVSKEPDEDKGYTFFTSDGLVSSNNIGRATVNFGIVDEIRSFGRTAAIKTFFKELACDMDVADKVQFIAEFDCPGTGRLTTLMEQSPDSGSYVGLTDEVDSLGLRRAELHWTINDRDRRTIRTVAREIAEAFARAGLGLVRLEDHILNEDVEIPVAPHAHHMGTTRMAAQPEYGVVDRNCKVFDSENLYVAGSSIFSTGGACNPTMPIVQFALRLADHLA